MGKRTKHLPRRPTMLLMIWQRTRHSQRLTVLQSKSTLKCWARRKAEKDDLTKIKGIGPFINRRVNKIGIYTFDQVAKMTPDIEEDVNKAIIYFPGRVRRDDWAGQAKEFAKKKK